MENLVNIKRHEGINSIRNKYNNKSFYWLPSHLPCISMLPLKMNKWLTVASIFTYDEVHEIMQIPNARQQEFRIEENTAVISI